MELKDGRARTVLRSFLEFLSYCVGCPRPSPLWDKARGLNSDQGPCVGSAPLFLGLGTGVASHICTVMDRAAPAPLLLTVPPLTDASAQTSAEGKTSASTQFLLGSFRKGASA